MEHVAVKSRDLALVGYNAAQQRLEIAFRSGGVYAYESVPASVHEALMKAPSLGIYFNENIKDKYPSKKISES